MTGAKVDRTSSGEPYRTRRPRGAALALFLLAAGCGEDPAPAGPRAGPAAGVTVRVEDAAGAPVADAYVRAEVVAAARPEDVRDPFLTSRTDARGIARVEGFRPAVEYRLEVTSD